MTLEIWLLLGVLGLGFLALLVAILFFLWGVVATAAWNARYHSRKHLYVKVVANVTGSLRPPLLMRLLTSKNEARRTASWIWVTFPFEGKNVRVRLQVTQMEADRAIRSGVVGLLVDPERPTDAVFDGP